MLTPNITERFSSVQHRLRAAARDAGRPVDSVRLLAVAKKKPVAAIQLLAGLGQRAFGENYVDEALEKIDALAGSGLEWHFIGPVQSNKTRAIAERFDWVQSVDRVKIARRLSAQRPDSIAPLNVLVQVNLDGEQQKSGCEPDGVPELAERIADSPGLRLRGLMAIPAPREASADQIAVFARLRTLYEALKRDFPDIDTLSAGMSGDLEAAIAAGSTLVRVGTDLFGPR